MKERDREKEKALRIEIVDLLDRYCARCVYGQTPHEKMCLGCPVFVEIRGLAAGLDVGWYGSVVEEILAKGGEMSREDMLLAILEGVEKTEIRRVLGLSATMFTKLLKDLQLTERDLEKMGYVRMRDSNGIAGGFRAYWEGL